MSDAVPVSTPTKIGSVLKHKALRNTNRASRLFVALVQLNLTTTQISELNETRRDLVAQIKEMLVDEGLDPEAIDNIQVLLDEGRLAYSVVTP